MTLNELCGLIIHKFTKKPADEDPRGSFDNCEINPKTNVKKLEN
jgi:hypothetical protein